MLRSIIKLPHCPIAKRITPERADVELGTLPRLQRAGQGRTGRGGADLPPVLPRSDVKYAPTKEPTNEKDPFCRKADHWDDQGVGGGPADDAGRRKHGLSLATDATAIV